MHKYLIVALLGILTLTGCKKEKLPIKSIEGLWTVTNLEIDQDGDHHGAQLTEYPDYNVQFNFAYTIAQKLGSFSTLKIIDKDGNQKLAVYKFNNDRTAIEIKDDVNNLKTEYLWIQEWTDNRLQVLKHDKALNKKIVLSLTKG